MTKHILITKSPALGGVNPFDGHIYEIIDYFYILDTSGCDVNILITEDLLDTLNDVIPIKYNFTTNYRDYLASKIITYTDVIDYPDSILLNVDSYMDYYKFNKIVVNVKHILTFRCFPTDMDYINEFASSVDIPITLLEDSRIYDNITNIPRIHYIKKVLFDKYNTPNSVDVSNRAFMYFNNVCKSFDLSKFIRLRVEYDNFYIIGPESLAYLNDIDGVLFETIPATDIFSKFSTYVYTGTSGIAIKEDCSCRLICEAIYFGKGVDVRCDYILDKPTQVRLSDCKNDITSVTLTTSDELLDIIYEI